MIIVATFGDFACGRFDAVCKCWIERAPARIHACGAQVQDAERPDQRHRHPIVADREILDGTLGLRAPIGGGRDVDRPETVRFLPGALHFFRLKSTATTFEPSPDGSGGPSFSARSFSSSRKSASSSWAWN